MIELGLLLALQGAVANVEVPLPDYDCEAPRGHYDKRLLDSGKANFRLAGTIHAANLGKDRSRWWSAAGILFQPEEGKGGIGLQVWQQPRSKHLTYGIRYLGSDSPSTLGTVPMDQAIEFVVSLDASGRLELQVNQSKYFISDAKMRPSHPILMCSGGHFRFQQLSQSSVAE
jgi:hypothetical protein